MRRHGRPSVWFGLLIGLFLTVPLAPVFYAGHRLAALPFVPFNIFDWQTRILPGIVRGWDREARMKATSVIGFRKANTDSPSDVLAHRRSNKKLRRTRAARPA